MKTLKITQVINILYTKTSQKCETHENDVNHEQDELKTMMIFFKVNMKKMMNMKHKCANTYNDENDDNEEHD